MPNLATHCAISKKRTGFDFKELHEWMDSPAAELGYDHRTIRHAYNVKEEKQIIEYWDRKKGRGWGERAIVDGYFILQLIICRRRLRSHIRFITKKPLTTLKSE